MEQSPTPIIIPSASRWNNLLPWLLFICAIAFICIQEKRIDNKDEELVRKAQLQDSLKLLMVTHDSLEKYIKDNTVIENQQAKIDSSKKKITHIHKTYEVKDSYIRNLPADTTVKLLSANISGTDSIISALRSQKW